MSTDSNQSRMTDFLTSTPASANNGGIQDGGVSAIKPSKKRTKIDRSGEKDELSESEYEHDGSDDNEDDEEMSNKDLKVFIKNMFTKFDARWFKVQQKVKKLETEHISLKAKFEVMENDLRQLKLDSNHNNQYSRKNNINIHGISESNGSETVDQCTDLVVETLKNKNIPISRDMVEIAHRVPGQPKPGVTRKIIVRLRLRSHKDIVMKNKKLLKGSPIRIYEDASPLNGKLLYDLRKHKDVENSWMTNGKVLAKLKSGRTRAFDILDHVGEDSELS